MSRIRSVTFALAVMALVPLPLLAQAGSQGRGGMGEGRQQGAPMMSARVLLEQGSVEFLVTKAAELALTTEQTSGLAQIGAAWAAETKPARDRIRAAMPQGGQGAGGDRQAMMQRMQEMRLVMQKLGEDDRTALDNALALLDTTQREKAAKLIAERTPARRGPPR